jgi:hypothetical protein
VYRWDSFEAECVELELDPSQSLCNTSSPSIATSTRAVKGQPKAQSAKEQTKPRRLWDSSRDEGEEIEMDLSLFSQSLHQTSSTSASKRQRDVQFNTPSAKKATQHTADRQQHAPLQTKEHTPNSTGNQKSASPGRQSVSMIMQLWESQGGTLHNLRFDQPIKDAVLPALSEMRSQGGAARPIQAEIEDIYVRAQSSNGDDKFGQARKVLERIALEHSQVSTGQAQAEHNASTEMSKSGHSSNSTRSLHLRSKLLSRNKSAQLLQQNPTTPTHPVTPKDSFKHHEKAAQASASSPVQLAPLPMGLVYLTWCFHCSDEMRPPAVYCSE